MGNLPGATSGIGWNMNYPFNTGDLLCCGQCAVNYLENNVKVRQACSCAHICLWGVIRQCSMEGANPASYK